MVVEVVFPLQLHGAKPHADPGVKLLELPATRTKRRGKVVRRPSDNSVQLHDDFRIQVAMSDGEVPYFRLEFQHRLVAGSSRVRREKEPKELIADG